LPNNFLLGVPHDFAHPENLEEFFGHAVKKRVKPEKKGKSSILSKFLNFKFVDMQLQHQRPAPL